MLTTSWILEYLSHLNKNLHIGLFLDAKNYGEKDIWIFKNILSPNDVIADQIWANLGKYFETLKYLSYFDK